MGKSNESVQRRWRNNARVDPATLTNFLCYYCGKSFSIRMDYQIHMLKVHEVMTQSYQLWSDHTMEQLGLRWSETKGHDDREASCSLPPSPVSRERKSRNSEDDDEDYVCEDEKPSKRRKRDEDRSRKSAAERQRRQASEKKKAEAAMDRLKKAEEKRVEKARKEDERRQQEAARRVILQEQQQADLRAAHEAEQMEAGRRMSLLEMGEMEMQRRGIESERKKSRKRPPQDRSGMRPQVDPVQDQRVADLVSTILSESKKKEASSQEVVDEDLNPEIIDRKPFDYTKLHTKYCKVCKKGTHYSFETLFEHYQDQHHATIRSFDYFGYKDKTLIGKKNLIERDYCQRCVTKFERPRDYYTHMIQNHIHESVRCQLDFENANNADIEVKFMFRDRILSLGYNFYFQDDAKISASSSDIADFQAGTVPVEIDQPSTSYADQQPSLMDRQVKLEPPTDMDYLAGVVKSEPPF